MLYELRGAAFIFGHNSNISADSERPVIYAHANFRVILFDAIRFYARFFGGVVAINIITGYGIISDAYSACYKRETARGR